MVTNQNYQRNIIIIIIIILLLLLLLLLLSLHTPSISIDNDEINLLD